eukprot:TRINITY_DN16047_c0_g1_i1.p1 TRINITY_DN16047_c0_g1~~TRINITY_DN16047_c0_g1_i1.p1  ORF type:complete len:469 (-),score=78.99 TRINITY_DN16047_c0_g1_i1:150-1556(-)
MKSASTVVLAFVGNTLPTDAVLLRSSDSAPGYIKRSLVEDEGQGVGNWHGWTENNKHTLMTLEKCSQLCNQNKGCNSFTFKPEKDNGWCHLKAKCVDEHTAAKAVAIDLFSSWYKEGSQGPWKQRVLVANEGNTIKLVSAPLADCQAQCDNHPQCKSVSYKGDEGLCKLHDKAISAKDEAKPQVSAYNTYYKPCASASKPPVSLASTNASATGLHKKAKVSFVKRSLVADEGSGLGDYHGWDEHNTHKAMTVDKCQELCVAKKGCNSVTFKPEKDFGWCHLKTKCVDERTPAKAFPIDVPTAWFKESGERIWSERSLVADEGKNLEFYPELTADACKTMCEANSACKSITFGGKKASELGFCHLKDKSVNAGAQGATSKNANEYKTYFLSASQGPWKQRSSVADHGKTLQLLSLTLSECQAKCDGNPQCESIAYKADDRLCKLQDKAISLADQAKEEHTAYSTYYKPC